MSVPFLRFGEPLDICGENVGLDIERGADLARTERGDLQRVGNQCDTEKVRFAPDQGQRDAVVRYRAFLGHLLGEFFRDFKVVIGPIPHVVDPDQGRLSVDVAADEMSAQARIGTERQFEVDRTAGL